MPGIWLNGFGVSHWVLYLPVATLTFAGITGICPGYLIFKKFGFKDQMPGEKI